MLKEIIRFELKYRWNRPATHIYFAILLVVAFASITWDGLTVGGGTGLVKENSPWSMALKLLTLSILPGLFISSAIMGVPILRDFKHHTASLIFTRPISKSSYVLGRFLGSFIITLYVFTGMIIGFLLGQLMPWLDPDQFLPFQFWAVVQPFLLYIIPTLFFTGVLFFVSGSYFKNMVFVMVQGVVILALFLVGVEMMTEMENRDLVSIMDPSFFNTFEVETQYWTVSEKNSQLIAPIGNIFLNRVIWLSAGIFIGFLFYASFRLNIPIGRSRRKKQLDDPQLFPVHMQENLPKVRFNQSWRYAFFKVGKQAFFYAREILTSLPFIVIMLLAFLIFASNSNFASGMYGTNTFPRTGIIASAVYEDFTLFFMIIIVFYTGWLVWRERDLNINLIVDALPVSSTQVLLSKFLGFLIVHVVMLGLMIVAGVGVQAINGYYNFEFGIYFSYFFTEIWVFMILYTILGLLIQVLANHKFLGYALMILFFIVNYFALSEMGVEHPMFRFASGALQPYSDMNAYGHFVAPFGWQQTYWAALAVVLFSVSVLFVVRGTDNLFATRLKLLGVRLSRNLAILGIMGFLLFAASGCFLYYNSNVLNVYQNSDAQEKLQADYEKTLKKYQNIAQPQIVETILEVDIYPEERNFYVEGRYVLKNNTDQSISEVHVQHAFEQEVTPLAIDFQGGAVLKEELKEFKYQIFSLNNELLPGDSIEMDWRLKFETPGFRLEGSSTQVVNNGTFFNNSFFPGIAYEPSLELSNDETRKEQGLPKSIRALSRTDSLGIHTNFINNDSDHIRFEITLSTTPDQIAIAPGYLQNEWTDNGRKYFHYKMDMPMFGFYSMISADYEVIREAWTSPLGNPINLEVYYHQDHTYNLEQMMEGMKKSFTYFEKAFSPYQYRQMRIMEFPRYSQFAQSFANTVPFSESIGFVLDIEDDDVDIPFYVTAHEMAHQWWGHQLMPAGVQGASMISETLSQYSALMVMKQHYKPELIKKFLEYELRGYLSGRSQEIKKEMPLELVEGQGYIHYRKGSLIMYALQDYIGEENVNKALRKALDRWAWKNDRFMTTDTLVHYFREVTPDSLQYLLTDFFEVISLYENRTLEASYAAQNNDTYLVEIPIMSTKYVADSVGNETPVPMSDWIDIGVYGKDHKGKDSLLYLKKHKITQTEMTIEVEVNAKPTKAGIDPLHKLIDRNPDDNVKSLELKVGS